MYPTPMLLLFFKYHGLVLPIHFIVEIYNKKSVPLYTVKINLLQMMSLPQKKIDPISKIHLLFIFEI